MFRKQLSLVWLVLSLMMVTSCKKDDISSDPGTITPFPTDIETFVETNLNGRIVSEQENPLVDVKVSVAGQQTRTDDNGVFRFENVDLSNRGTLVFIEKEGYFDGFKFANGWPGENSFLDVTLITKAAEEFQSDQGGVVSLSNRSSIEFQANSIADMQGATYTGPVIVYAHWYDPSSADLHKTMPGDLRGLSADDSRVQLISYGMMAVELETPSGDLLQLRDNMTATISAAIPNGSNAYDYTSIPTWHFDELNGVWIEEGSALRSGDALIAEVSHFSFWNFDVPFPLVTITGQLVDLSGEPLSYADLLIKDAADNLARGGKTNQSGYFRGQVPLGEELVLFTEDCDELLTLSNLGSLDGDKDLKEIIVDLSKGVSIKGQLVDCNMQKITNGYATLVSDEGIQVINPDADGNFSHSFFQCDQTEMTFQAYDLERDMISEPIRIDLDQGDIDLELVSVCDQNTEMTFMRFTVDDGEFYNVMNEMEVIFVDDKILYIYGNIENDPSGIPIYILLKYDLSNNLSSYNSQGVSQSGQAFNFAGANLNLTITPFNGQGDLVQGTFDAGNFSGIFNLEIIREVSAGLIRGTIWQDNNSNGIQEPDESGVQGKTINLIQDKSILLSPSYYPSGYPNKEVAISDENGNYFFDGVILDTDLYLEYRSDNDEDITIADVGMDDEVDSDFKPVAGLQNTYRTEFITVTENIESTGNNLGLVPTGFSCSTDLICCPTSGIFVYAAGGEAPYSLRIRNDGNALVHDQEHNIATIEVFLETGRTYDILIEDNTGAQCSSTIEVPTYLNKLNGQVWIDALASGIQGQIDADDMSYAGLEVRLIDAEGTIVDQTISDGDGSYVFENFLPENYRIQVELPANFEFLEQGDIQNTKANHIDPDTGISFEKEIGGWDWTKEHIINIGLKEL